MRLLSDCQIYRSNALAHVWNNIATTSSPTNLTKISLIYLSTLAIVLPGQSTGTNPKSSPLSITKVRRLYNKTVSYMKIWRYDAKKLRWDKDSMTLSSLSNLTPGILYSANSRTCDSPTFSDVGGGQRVYLSLSISDCL